MLITDKATIAEIQESFSSHFPNLKIEFYKKDHELGEGSVEKEKWPQEKNIGQIRNTHQNGDLRINGHLKVATLEKLFHDEYGLNVQVFRKSGSAWLQTTATDEWTLSEQNSRGQN